MAVTDAEVEQLECYLDDELSLDEAAQLQRRVASDPSLCDALDELRRQRELRTRVWQSMEPETAEVARLGDRIDGMLRRQANWSKRLAALRYIGSAAACLLVGFMISHSMRPASSTDGNVAGSDVEISSSAAPHGPVYQVVLQDETGNVVGVQNFDSLNDAREFQSDVGQVQNKHRQIQNNIRLITDQF